jgi:hypothetical protein
MTNGIDHNHGSSTSPKPPASPKSTDRPADDRKPAPDKSAGVKQASPQ